LSAATERPDGRFGFVYIDLDVMLETNPGYETDARSAAEDAERSCLVAASLDTRLRSFQAGSMEVLVMQRGGSSGCLAGRGRQPVEAAPRSTGGRERLECPHPRGRTFASGLAACDLAGAGLEGKPPGARPPAPLGR
jgi:hypothetical protein